jgi:hypothetical protein
MQQNEALEVTLCSWTMHDERIPQQVSVRPSSQRIIPVSREGHVQKMRAHHFIGIARTPYNGATSNPRQTFPLIIHTLYSSSFSKNTQPLLIVFCSTALVRHFTGSQIKWMLFKVHGSSTT